MNQTDRLLKLIADFEAKAQALRIAVAVLQQHDQHSAVQALPGKLAAAQQLRLNGSGKKLKKGEVITATILAMWATAEQVHTADVIARVQADHQRQVSGATVVTAVRRLRGRKKGNAASAHWLPPRGWTPAATPRLDLTGRQALLPASGNGHGTLPPATKAAQRRQRMADTLREFSGQPVPVDNAKRLAPLIRRGYLKKKRNGYVATAKAARWLGQAPA